MSTEIKKTPFVEGEFIPGHRYALISGLQTLRKLRLLNNICAALFKVLIFVARNIFNASIIR